MPNIPTGDPDLLHLAAVRTSERWNNLISTTSPLVNPNLPIATNFLTSTCVIKGIPHDSALTRSCYGLSSDHSPVLITLSLCALDQAPQPTSCNRKTNWDYFLHLITVNLTLHVPLKTTTQIEDTVKYFTNNTTDWMDCYPGEYLHPLVL
jgi:hypothetical protein